MSSTQTVYFRLLGHFRPYLWVACLTLLAIALAAATDVMLVAQLQTVLDAFRPAQTLSIGAAKPHGTLAWVQGLLASLPLLDPRQSTLWAIPAIIFALATLRMTTSFVGEYGAAWLSSRVQTDLRTQMFGRVLTLPNRFFDHSSTGTTLSRIAFDASQVSQAVLNVLTVMVRDSVATIGYLMTLFTIDWQLALFCLGLLPLVGIVVTLAGKRMRKLSQSGQAAMGELTRVLDESIGGQRVVKIFGGQAYEQARFEQVTNLTRRLMVKQAATSALNSGLIMLLIGITLSAVIYFALLRANAGALTPGAFIAFMGSLISMQGPIKNLTKINEPMQRGLAAAESVFGLIDETPETDSGVATLPRAQGQISLRQVGFRYNPNDADSKPALQGLSLEIAPGETIALVGSSGSGKTTLAALLPRFYDTHEGSILLDGTDLRDYPLATLRRQIALVSQEVVLFNDTLAANIAYGDPRPDLDRIMAAAKAAYAHEFIAQLPDGYQSQIGENGTRLSGGQRQRMAIARALYKDAPILILDEATSALDNESERQVQAALDVLMKNRTTLVIAHRLSTIEHADRIVAMQAGQIAEVGTHAELLARDGVYAGLYRQQRAGMTSHS